MIKSEENERRFKMPKKPKLPSRLIALENADKKFHEKWYSGRDMLNFPHPFRVILAAPPHSGKSTVIKNILLRADPPFQKIVLVHCDPENTAEYDDIECVETRSDIPMPEEWSGECKTLCIIDDIELKKLKSDQIAALSRLFGYVSTHKHLSVCLTSQDPYQIPSIVRRSANVFVLWKLVDLNALIMTARKTGYSAEDFNYFFNCLTKGKHDSIWIDLTENTPYPLRLNGYVPITNFPSKQENARKAAELSNFTHPHKRKLQTIVE